MEKRSAYGPIKFGRALKAGSDTEYVYYREIPAERLEFYDAQEGFWDQSIFNTWHLREKAEFATRLSWIDYAMLPQEARTNQTRMTVAMGALDGFKKAQAQA